jgi:hypothetical protein
MGGLIEQPKRTATKEVNLIFGSKQRSKSSAMTGLLDQRETPLLVVERVEEGVGHYKDLTF